MFKIYFFIILLVIPTTVIATSGCCSSHGGVDCSLQQSNGKVVCNDGWTGSSCLYSSIIKCNVSEQYVLSDNTVIDTEEYIEDDVIEVIKEKNEENKSYIIFYIVAFASIILIINWKLNCKNNKKN